ncbi:SH3 domain-containing protein [Sphingomonas colocasiae]|uniref:SH3 domain-containing protein n=1 Tax=Sphingomonas colocasiae TaxID=1848973 RepID=A0ABS7PQ30_9SPHN|nr:SH3 domain-containing protein [Sphingomonas colocasiae]MBY8823445.1 SH3 domain-containing protein [Sphingomonas colocasiae]
MAQSSGAGCFGWLIAGILGIAMISQCSSKQGSPTPDAPAAASGTQRYVDARSLNCRSGASASATPLRAFARGTPVTVTEEANSWSKIDGSPPCWVSSAFLSSSAPMSGTASSDAMPAAAAATAAGTAAGTVSYFTSQPQRAKATRSGKAKARKERSSTKRRSRGYDGGGCPCSGSRVCIGPRGGRYCITSGGNKRYGV